jgi:hypothetical protein
MDLEEKIVNKASEPLSAITVDIIDEEGYVEEVVTLDAGNSLAIFFIIKE